MLREAFRALERLVEEREAFFDRNERLNSEGRKLLEAASRILAREARSLRGYVRRARRSGSLEDVVRLLEALRELSGGD
ncbi:MAG: hypothetical protein QXU97_03905 [Fervidicoccaceae archaeon]